MMTSFEEFVGALFKDIQPLSNFDIIRICKKLKISNFRGCFMRDEISYLDAVSNNDECFIMNYRSKQFIWNTLGSCEYRREARHTILIHSVFLPLRKLKDIVRNLDSTIHSCFKNPTK